MIVKAAVGNRIYFLFRRYCYILLLFLCAIPAGLIQAQTAKSRVDPQIAAKGQRASYKVTLQGVGSPQPVGGSLPKVPGLNISGSASTSTQMQVINGSMRRFVTYSFPLVGEKLGTYTIPAWDMTFGNRIIKVPATTIKVVDTDDVFNGIFQLELHLDKSSYYVGERISGKLQLLVREGVEASLSGLPEKIGDAFVQKEFKENFWKIAPEVRDGIRYDMATARLTLTAIKSGRQSLQYKVPINVRVKNRQTRFRDPFFDDFFPGRNQYKTVTLETNEKSWEIKPLPSEGKPDRFTGAVGQFEASVSFSPSQVSAGEPVNLKLQITGFGNFDRIQAPKLESTEDHKVYPPKIEFSQNTTAPEGFGTKTFEYIIIPKHEDADTLMGVPFLFFEPKQGIYVDQTQRPGEMVVLAPPAGTQITHFNEPVVHTANSKAPQEEPQDARKLLPIETNPGKWHKPGERSIWTPAFISAQITSLALISGIFIVRRRQIQLDEDSQFRRQVQGTKEMRAWKQKTEKAFASRNVEDFLDSARRTLQISVSKELSSSEAEALTFDSIREHLESQNLEEDVIHNAQALFDAADLLKFGGADAAGLNLEDLNNSLNSVLKALK